MPELPKKRRRTDFDVDEEEEELESTWGRRRFQEPVLSAEELAAKIAAGRLAQCRNHAELTPILSL